MFQCHSQKMSFYTFICLLWSAPILTVKGTAYVCVVKNEWFLNLLLYQVRILFGLTKDS